MIDYILEVCIQLSTIVFTSSSIWTGFFYCILTDKSGKRCDHNQGTVLQKVLVIGFKNATRRRSTKSEGGGGAEGGSD